MLFLWTGEGRNLRVLGKIFSGSAGDLNRWNPLGGIVMTVGALLAFLAGHLARGREGLGIALRLIGLIVTIVGALVTVRLFG